MGEKPPVLTTALTAVVEAGSQQVWRAVTDPAELIRWDGSALKLLQPCDDWPAPGSSLVWRYQLGAVTVQLRDRALELEEAKRLRSAVSLGLFKFEQIWSVARDDEGNGRARVGLSIAARNEVPVLGETLDRFDVRRLAAEYVDGRLRRLREWCANGAGF